MTKKKHFHGLSGKGKQAAAYAFFHRLPASGSKYLPRQKKTARGAANTTDGKVEQIQPSSTSNDTGKGGHFQA